MRVRAQGSLKKLKRRERCISNESTTAKNTPVIFRCNRMYEECANAISIRMIIGDKKKR